MVALGSSLLSTALWGLALLSVSSAAPVAAPLDQRASTPLKNYNLRVLPLGDSITYGYQSTDGNGYRLQLYNDLKNGPNTVNMIGSVRAGNMPDPDNEGHNGYRIDQIISLAATNSSLAQHPNIVLLHIGTNDMNQNYQVSTAPSRLASLIDQIFANDPTTTLIVAQIIASTDSSLQSRIDAYNAQIPSIVNTRASQGRHILRVDMSHLLNLSTQMADSLHPNNAGYAVMGNAWYSALEQANGMGWIKNAT